MDCLLCKGSARFHKIEKPKFNTTPCLGLADINLLFLVKKTMEKNITLLCFLLVFPTLEKPCILQATLLEDSVFAIMLKYWKSTKKTMKKTSRCCASCWCVPPLKNHIFYRLPCLRTVFLQLC